ncbi:MULTISPECIES: hypothetical protein [unclassified Pseudofrankia]|uniref:hypothetical protein n=1 Tax=unclassified Pseudofrankia TaxID=2994372 RepID=UPI0008D95611|nr:MULTISPECIES: hypothetical protein [unclassified Pseudofrankia]MDT3443626.1 hypothetical protein [Pseudofrankia sp. BMG5.37]OHV43922.1 hypothetical protein BCD48_26315 [Pseudofrankia sp. BMG5.36]
MTATATAAALVTALTACGSGDSSAPASAGGGAATVSVPAAAPLHPADYVLVAGPATSGYSMEDNTDTTESSVFQDPVPTCMHLSSADLGPASTDHANGPVFSDDDGTTIQSGARVFASADTVTAHRALTQRPDFPGCVGEAIVSQLSNRDREETTVTVKSAQAGTPPTGATALTRLDLAVSSDGQSLEANVDLVSVFAGRVESVILIVSPAGPVDDGELNGLTGQVLATLAKQ